MNRWLREPLLHFFLAGAALFAFTAWQAPADGDDSGRRIEISAQTHEFVRARFRRQWGRDPGPAEERAALDEWIREEVLYREGLALKLADNDPIVRRRIGQKMTMLANAMAPPLPDDATLLAWFEARPDAYRSPPSYSFEQRFYADKGDVSALQRATDTLLALTQESAVDIPAGDLTLLPTATEQVSSNYIVSNFGQAFLDRLADLPLGRWAGPVRSSLGAHLVRLGTRVEGRPLTFEAARAQVESDWLYDNASEAAERFIAELRARYEVVDTSTPDSLPAG